MMNTDRTPLHEAPSPALQIPILLIGPLTLRPCIFSSTYSQFTLASDAVTRVVLGWVLFLLWVDASLFCTLSLSAGLLWFLGLSFGHLSPSPVLSHLGLLCECVAFTAVSPTHAQIPFRVIQETMVTAVLIALAP